MALSLSKEVSAAQFGDQRLTKRLGKIADELGAKPTMSVPAAAKGRAEMEAAYRFFDDPKVSPEKIRRAIPFRVPGGRQAEDQSSQHLGDGENVLQE